MLGSRLEGGLVEPIVNATRPATLAGLSLTILKFGSEGDPLYLKLILAFGAIMFVMSSFFIFFYTLYPTRHRLWILTSACFFFGLCCTALSSIILLIFVT